MHGSGLKNAGKFILIVAMAAIATTTPAPKYREGTEGVAALAATAAATTAATTTAAATTVAATTAAATTAAVTMTASATATVTATSRVTATPAKTTEPASTKSPTTKSPTHHTTKKPETEGTPYPLQACVKDTSDCKCTLQDGYILDLSALANKEGNQPRFTMVHDNRISLNTYFYSWNPCNAFEINTTESINSCTVKDDVAVCQNTSIGDTGEEKGFLNIGKQSTADFTYRLETEEFYVTYTGGVEDRSSRIELVCNEDIQFDESTLEFIEEEEEKKQYRFLLESPAACIKTGGRSLSGGSIFLIIFFSLVGAYLLFGLLINTGRGKKGAEAFPNYNTWGSICGNVKTGMSCICPCCSSTKSAKYEQF